MSNIFACFLQSLACKLGSVTGKDLAQNFRLYLHNWLRCPLYVLSELAIMPHAIFLGSHVTLPRVREFDRQHHPERILHNNLGEEYKWQPSISAIRATLSYSISELVISLSTFAMFVNSAILIVAGTALY